MASKKLPYFSDDELKAELKKLGYNDVTPDVFNLMKNDLSILVEKDDISSRNPKNISPVRYTSNLKQLRSTKDIHNLSENDSSPLRSNDSIKNDLYSKYKNRFNSYGLNIETRSPDEKQPGNIYQGATMDCKTDTVNNIAHDQDGKITRDSDLTVKVLKKTCEKDNLSINVPKVVRSPVKNFVNNNSHLMKSSNDKGCHIKDDPLKTDKDKKATNKLHGLNSIDESSCAASASKNYHDKDKSLKIDHDQSLCKSDKNKSSVIEIKSLDQGISENGSVPKKKDPSSNKMKRITLMTSKTKATLEYQSLNFKLQNQSRSSIKSEASTENAEYQNNSENEKPEVNNIVTSSSKSVSRILSKSKKKYDQNSEKNGSRDIKSTLINRRTQVLNDSLNSSDSTCSIKSNEHQTNKLKESSLKSHTNFENSNSLNLQDSAKLPSIEHPRSSKMSGQNISSSILHLSTEIENGDSKSSKFSLDSSLEGKSHENKFVSSASFDSSSPEMDDSLLKYRFSTSNRPQPERPGQNHFSSLSSFDSSRDPGDLLEKYRQRFKLNAYSSQENLLRASSVKIKRKVLRHRNGESIVTEELLNVPSIFTSSYPSTELGLESTKSISSDDLSFQRSVVPDLLRSSYSTPRSIHVRIANQRKKKTDPVAMYNYYKKFWSNFKPPGEKSHDKLRWAVRDRMLDYKL